VLTAVVDASVDGEAGVDEARAAVAAAIGHPERADDVLEALTQDGAATLAGDRLRLDRAWLEQNAFLLAGTGLKVLAHECVDLAAGLSRPTALTVLDSEPRRLLLLPPTLAEPEPDTLLAFEPVTRDAVRLAVFGLLDAPAAPPTEPHSDYEGDPRAWFAAASEGASEWRSGFWDRVPALADDLPDALTAPGATLELIERDAGRRVIGMTAESAVEWTAAGSRVTWRTLGDVSGRVAELLPGDPGAAEAGTSYTLDEPARRWLAGAGGDGASLPAELLPLAPGSGARWLALRALVRSGEVLHGVELLLAAGAAGELWRFEAEQVSRVSVQSVLDEIRDSLAPVGSAA
jgi:hypothetical protein